jgi:sterol desaturase/sphingolipid hydroxylase (fatty acid hydroxylase superfamily)
MIRLTQACIEAAARPVEVANSLAGRPGTPRSIRLFENPVLEAASRAHPVTPAVWFLPFLIWSAVHALGALGLRSSAPLFVAGWLGFSLFEYLLHRFVFHGLLRGVPSEGRQAWGFVLHGYHHHFPNDPRRLVLPPLFSWPIALLFAGGYVLLLGPQRAIPAIGGTLAGYLALFSVHYYVHHCRPARGLGWWLRRYHLRHHHRDANCRYGVTSPLWDVVFGTTGSRSPPKPLSQPGVSPPTTQETAWTSAGTGHRQQGEKALAEAKGLSAEGRPLATDLNHQGP